VPCWVDLTVTDVPAAAAFYGQVLGWTFTDTSDDFGGYVLGQVDGAAAAGIGPTAQPGLPSSWTLYLASNDTDATAKLITDAGGTMLLPPGDVGPLGRLLVAADPTGAVFGVWQAGEQIGTELHSEPGGLSWEDLRTDDPLSAWAFYRAVFGYETHPLEGAGPDYATFHLPGDPAPLGGMGGMFGADGGPHWVVSLGRLLRRRGHRRGAGAGPRRRRQHPRAPVRLGVREDGDDHRSVRRDVHGRADRRVQPAAGAVGITPERQCGRARHVHWMS
jgi:predicted enzyme related to lactoylglutathione lyase